MSCCWVAFLSTWISRYLPKSFSLSLLAYFSNICLVVIVKVKTQNQFYKYYGTLCVFNQFTKLHMPFHYIFINALYPVGKYWSSGRLEGVSLQRPLNILFDHLDLNYQWCPDLTSQGRPESTSGGRILVEVRKTSLEGHSEDVLRRLWGRLFHVPKFHFTSISKLNIILRGVFRTQSNICFGTFLRK